MNATSKDYIKEFKIMIREISSLRNDLEVDFNRFLKSIEEVYNMRPISELLLSELLYLFTVERLDDDGINNSICNISYVFSVFKTELVMDDYYSFVDHIKDILKLYLNVVEELELYEICINIKKIKDYVDTEYINN